MKHMSVVFASALIALVALGCSSGDDKSPTGAFKTYLRLVYLDKDEQAWEMVHAPDRARLLEAHKQLEAAGIQPPSSEHKALLIRTIYSPYALKSVELVEPISEAPSKGDVAKVRFELRDGREGFARLIWADGAWQLKLYGA